MIAKTLLKDGVTAEGITIPDIKLYNRTIVMKTVLLI